MSTSESKKITLKSSDGEDFEVGVDVALQSQTLKHIIDDDCADAVIPIPNVDSKILTKVIKYCNFHVASDKDADEVKAFDDEFITCDNVNQLFDIVLAANYLDIKSLLNLTCQTIADNIKDKTPEEVRKIFNIKNDFTPEEEEALRNQNQWAFE